MLVADTSGGCKSKTPIKVFARTVSKRAITWAYGWHLISTQRAQRIINRYRLWSA